MSRALTSLPGLVWLELTELKCSGPRARLGLAAGLAVGIAILLALLLRLEIPFWAGISAFVCMQANQPQSLRKGVMRLFGTFLGAALALLIYPLVAYNQPGTVLLLFVVGSVSILGSLVSRYAYAWLLGGITMCIIILGALDDPSQILHLAFNRCFEISIGTAVALATAALLLPATAAPAAPPPGWASLAGERAYMVGHALRTGVAIALVPVIWRIFELPDLSQMAISIGAVMAVPVLTGRAHEDHHAVNERAVQRVLGCLVGGGAGLLLLATPLVTNFVPWLLVLMVGAGISAQIETGRHGIATIGLQSGIALIVTFVQGWGPAVSPSPALDRFAGMLGAIVILVMINYLFGPVSESRA